MLRKITKVFLFIALITLILGFVFWIVLIKNYPWWIGLSVIVGFVGIWFGLIFIKKSFHRRKEEEFVHAVIIQDEVSIKTAPAQERQHLKELQEKWKESVELLRHSYLRRKGNPLYVLPWYLIIGESGAGKTSAIKNTNLNSPLGDDSIPQGISVTKNCDWWFFEEAVILDTAGRYTIPIDDSIDKEEWEGFLVLLAKFRKKEPINGVIVTIASDKLQEMNSLKLNDEGQSVRKRLDQLMRILGAKFPIYILITKIDLIQGMVEFTNNLPSQSLSQAMGYINIDSSNNWNEIIDKTFLSISKNLKKLQSVFIYNKEISDPEVFLFIHGFERLQPGLTTFINSIFEVNPYQETPYLRGIFFSSALQARVQNGEWQNILGCGPEENQAKIHHDGLFLKDFFQVILPRDRYQFKPILEFLSARNITKNFGIISWVMIWLFLCSMMTFSYFNTISAINVVKTSSLNPPVMNGNYSHDITLLNQLRQKVLSIEKINSRWPIKRIGFNQSFEIENEIKAQYIKLFKENILRPFDISLMMKMENSEDSTLTYTDLNNYEYLIERINLLRESINNSKDIKVEKLEDLSSEIIITNNNNINQNDAGLFGECFYNYLFWNSDKTENNSQIEKLNTFLSDYLIVKNRLEQIAYLWITPPSNIYLADLWYERKDINLPDDVSLSGKYTYESQKQLQEFFGILEKSLEPSDNLNNEKNKFWDSYINEFYSSWENFASDFVQRMDFVEDKNKCKNISESISFDNPYFNLIDRMSEEIKNLPQTKEKPQWAELVVEINDIQKLSQAEAEKDTTSLLSKIENKKEKVMHSTIVKVDKKKEMEYQKKKEAIKAIKEYKSLIEKISASITSGDNCFVLVSDYLTNSSNSESPFSLADNKCLKLKSLVSSNTNFPWVWEIMSGPQHFLLNYAMKETACVLQKKWDEQVLGEIKSTEKENLNKVLFDKNAGLVWKFTNTTCKPFLINRGNGFLPQENISESIIFTDDFISFLNKGAETPVSYEPCYIVNIETLPLTVNKDADIKPYGCIWGLQCVDDLTTIENYNYPQSKTIKWSPEKCGEVSLKILLPELTLTKSYEGKLGFAEFLSEFRDGSRKFYANEFLENEKYFSDNNISWIRLSFKISGSDPVIKLLERNPSRVPFEIVSCW